MKNRLYHKSLSFRFTIAVGITLFATIFIWSSFNIRYQKERIMAHIVEDVERLSDTIKLGTHYAMMLNSRYEINQIINNIGRQKDIRNIRIYNKEGEVKFSNHANEVDIITNIRHEACFICHQTDPPRTQVPLPERIRIITKSGSPRRMGIICPIPNEPSCSSADCHIHSPTQKILGALDVVVSLDRTDREIVHVKKGVFWLAVFLFMATTIAIYFITFKFVSNPISRLIGGTRKIAGGNFGMKIDAGHGDEIGELAGAINWMSGKIGEKQAEVDKQRAEYQHLFEIVPCLITVQDRNFRLLRYNREFEERFAPTPNDYCYAAYKGSDKICDNCPVEKTLADGLSHYGEQSGVNKDGTLNHWVVRTSPVIDADGNIIAAMEINLDITHLKILEEKLKASEEKYHTIFNNIPNSVFVLDIKTLSILDCNDSVTPVYGYEKNQVKGMDFLDLFPAELRGQGKNQIQAKTSINKVRQICKDGRIIVANLRISPSEYAGKKVYLVSSSDITRRLEAEQQLIQAGKMATLGEMATGIAHELNQPLSVIRTASSFLIRKMEHNEPVDPEVSGTMLRKIDGNVERATRIINSMRQFARKSDVAFEPVQINQVLKKAFDIFSQQLKARGIQVEMDLAENLPPVNADPNRLEQVFINLIINARDAIESRWEKAGQAGADRRIHLKSSRDTTGVVMEIRDTGVGLPPGVEERIFEPFFTTKEAGKGTGLGLSISYGIVKEHGGKLKASNAEGGGACFSLTLPAREDTHDQGKDSAHRR